MTGVNLICPRCRGTMHQSEIYWESGKKMVEISCYQCPKQMFIQYNKFYNFVWAKVKADRAAKR